jgi:alpha-mannosidase
MIRRTLAVLVAIFVLVSSTRAAPATAPSADTCLMAVARNLANGGGNFFLYATFSTQRLAIQPADVLEYDVYLDKANPQPVGGVDVDTGRGNLRDSGAVDQNSLRAHGDTDLRRAVGHWYHRTIPLKALEGQRVRRWNVQFEGDAGGTYAQFIANIRVARGDGSAVPIEFDFKPADPQVPMKEGYSRYLLLKTIERSRITDGVDLTDFVKKEMEQLAVKTQLEDLRVQIELARKMSERVKDEHLQQHVAEATALLENAEKSQSLDAESLQSLIHQVHGSLNHEHPEMRKYTGHLVGHAHIDFQWLWEWPETVQVCHDTFNQALKFMDEFPGFKFSQSSSSLYAATEQAWPQIFDGIKKRVACGDWEIVGGRVCEGDENMISPESHARHFLYGQRYFRERFDGKQATVGWEPDTFGHTWQFPQILKLGGCNYFYFCRGGHGKPLFWWQGPDGTKVLSFEEPATGGWYNGDVAANRFDRLFKWIDQTGAKDMLWVYGVGNHGGGPTRENIQAALGFQKLTYLPTVRFSTATEFFNALSKYDLSNIPTVDTDLNTPSSMGFYGVYTTHSDIKRWNRDAEATTESAETIAAVASRYGFEYPTKEFRRNWEDICWNHHHDTLPGTSIHPSYNRSEAMYKRVIESSRDVGGRALAQLATKVKSDDDGVLVMNPCAWRRSGLVEISTPPPADKNVIQAGDQSAEIQLLGNGKAIAFVSDLPSVGWQQFAFKTRQWEQYTPPISVMPGGSVMENRDFKVTIDPARGVVSSIIDKATGRETIAQGGSANRLEIHWEKQRADAWTLNAIEKVDPLLEPVKLTVSETGPARATVAWDRKFQSTIIHQRVTLLPQGPPQFGIDTEWKELGAADKPCPMLKVAFDIAAGDKPVVTYQIPFATIERPVDGKEYPALKFVDFSSPDGVGAAVVNDCKHGYSAKGNTLYLSLIRSTMTPDAHPNDRPQSANWSVVPHSRNWREAGVLQFAESFNHPLWCATTKSNPLGRLPAMASMLSTDKADVVVTQVKKAEDDDDLVIRFYEGYGGRAETKLTTPFAVKQVRVVNFMEDELSRSSDLRTELHPYEIQTLKVATGE